MPPPVPPPPVPPAQRPGPVAKCTVLISLSHRPTLSVLYPSQAYRQLAKRLHPDKGGDPAAFGRLQAAFDVLGDAQKRQVYDTWAKELQFRWVWAQPQAFCSGLHTPAHGGLHVQSGGRRRRQRTLSCWGGLQAREEEGARQPAHGDIRHAKAPAPCLAATPCMRLHLRPQVCACSGHRRRRGGPGGRGHPAGRVRKPGAALRPSHTGRRWATHIVYSFVRVGTEAGCPGPACARGDASCPSPTNDLPSWLLAVPEWVGCAGRRRS